MAVTEPAGRWDEPESKLEAPPDSGEWVLRGTKSFVIDGHTADTLIVAARTSLGPAGISLFIVPGEDVARLPAGHDGHHAQTGRGGVRLVPGSR